MKYKQWYSHTHICIFFNSWNFSFDLHLPGNQHNHCYIILPNEYFRKKWIT